MVRLPSGFAPSAPAKLASVVSWPVDLAIRDRAVAARPAKGCRPEHIAHRVADDPPKRIFTIGASEGRQRRQFAVDLAISKTVPSPRAPPMSVVPNRSPAASLVTHGSAPSAGETRHGGQGAGRFGDLNTVPSLSAHLEGYPEHIARRIAD